MKKYFYTVTVLLFVGVLSLNAQNKATEKADKYYDRLQYVKAAEEYEELVEDDEADAYVYKKLANTYYNLYDAENAQKYYKLYLDNEANPEAEALYRYAQMLKASGDYDESEEVMKQFAEVAPNDKRAQSFKNNRNYLNNILNSDPKFEVTSLDDINTELSDFGGYVFDNKLYFVSARNKSRRDYGWNDQPTLDVYVAQKVGDTYKDAELIEGDVNSKYHEGTVSISPDGETVYFTRNDYLDGDYNKNSNGVGELKIYKATLVNEKWDDVQELPFNDSEYSTGHTALSPDGKTLYFSSDMPGGSGESDLYKVAINEDGTFGEPENLGSGINTPGRENFPYIDSEGTLYFSSDGHLGIGGLDVFYAKAEGSSFGDVVNLGQPVNSSGDDFAFYFDLNEETGFVSSNRGGVAENVANDNIYMVKQIAPLEEIMLEVKVIDSDSDEIIAGAEVLIYDEEDNEVASATTDADGVANFTLPGRIAYDVQVNADDYESNSAAVSKDEVGEVNLEVALDPIQVNPESIDLKPIYFEFDQSNITAEAAFELDKLIKTLEKYPNMDVLVESHTDVRGSNAYNQKLSERRAQATVDYLIENGVPEDRISSNGLGETKPKIECGSECTEEEHQKNRRSEFTLALKID